MSKLTEGNRDPYIDSLGTEGKRGIVAIFLRIGKRIGERIHRKRVQRDVDKRWHDGLRVGKPERDEP
jgi:hypothetical protein